MKTYKIIFIISLFFGSKSYSLNFNLNQIQQVKENWKDSITKYNKEIMDKPSNPDNYYNRALAHYFLKNDYEAIIDFSKSIELQSRDVFAYYFRAKVKTRVNDLRGALFDYNKLLELDKINNIKSPFLHDVILCRSDIYLELGEFKKAIIDLNLFISFKDEKRIYFAYFRRGVVKMKLDDNLGAINDFNKSIELNPFYAGSYSNRGLAKIMLNRKNEGCLDLSKAGELGYIPAYEIIKRYCN